MKNIVFIVGIIFLFANCKQNKTVEPSTIKYLKEGVIELLDEELNDVLNPKSQLEILSEGHDWTEGPLWLDDMEMLLFSDIPRNTVYSWHKKKGTKIYLKPSGFTGENFEGSEPGANGLLLDPHGSLVLCQHGNRVVAKMASPLDQPSSVFTELVADYQGRKLNSPNDAIFDSMGNLYFTDPPYGLPKQMKDASKELNFQGVYKSDLSGNTRLIDSTLSRPNGIALSPDEKKLLVANSDPEKAIWISYEFNKDGTVATKKTFFDVTHLTSKEKGLPDGLKINRKGFVFATGPGGVFIFNRDGKHLGTIKTGQATSNVALNKNETELYITADSYILKLNLQ